MVVAWLCLAAPVVALLWVGSYAKEAPDLGGIPFFFWYQLMWVFIASALTWFAYVVFRNRDIARRAERSVAEREARKQEGEL